MQSGASVLQRVHLVNVQRVAVLENRKDDRQSDSGFRGCYNHDEKREDMPIYLLELIGKRNKAQVNGIQHQFDGHEHRDDVAAEEKAGDSKDKQDRAQNQIPR
jgi:hypothetical protein